MLIGYSIICVVAELTASLFRTDKEKMEVSFVFCVAHE